MTVMTKTYDIKNGMGGLFTVKLIDDNKAAVIYGSFINGKWKAWPGEFDGVIVSYQRDKLLNASSRLLPTNFGE